MNLTASLLALLLVLQPTTRSAPEGVSMGDAALQAGTFEDAGPLYSRALTANPKDVDALVGLGTVELYRNQIASATRLLRDALAIDPQNRSAREQLHSIEDRTGSPTDFRMHQTGEVDVPFVETDPLPLIRANVNGHPVMLLLDTGASTISLNEAAVKEIGLKAMHLDTLAVGGLTIHGMVASMDTRPPPPGDEQIDGFIGTGFLYHFLASIDYVHGRLILRPRTTSGAFEIAALARGAAVIPMWLVGDRFIFADASVNDSPSGLFNVDTGGDGFGVEMTKSALDAAGIPLDPNAPTSTFSVGGGYLRTVSFSAASVALGSFANSNVPGVYFTGGDRYAIFPFPVAGSLAHLFFRHSVVTFDFDTMQLTVAKG